MSMFALDTDDAIKDRIENADPTIQEKHAGLGVEAFEIQSAVAMKMAEAQRITEEMQPLALQIHQAEKEVKKTGRGYSSETTTGNASNGGEVTTKTATNYLENLKADYAALAKKKQTLLNAKRPANWLTRCDDALADTRAPLIPFDGEPAEVPPLEGRQLPEVYAGTFAKVNDLAAKVKAAWNAPLTVAEGLANLDKVIDALAAQPPNFGGLIRGSSIGPRGELQIGNPGMMIGFVEEQIAQTFTVNAAKTMAFFMKDQMKKVAREHIKKTFTDEGAISAAEKKILIPKLEAELWQARRVCEATYLACRAAGIRNLNRPKDTPVEILLDVVPFDKVRRMRVQAAPVVVADEFEDSDDL
jgi:hypothetical protein